MKKLMFLMFAMLSMQAFAQPKVGLSGPDSLIRNIYALGKTKPEGLKDSSALLLIRGYVSDLPYDTVEKKTLERIFLIPTFHRETVYNRIKITEDKNGRWQWQPYQYGNETFGPEKDWFLFCIFLYSMIVTVLLFYWLIVIKAAMNQWISGTLVIFLLSVGLPICFIGIAYKAGILEPIIQQSLRTLIGITIGAIIISILWYLLKRKKKKVRIA